MNSRLKEEHDTSKTKFMDLISGEHMNQQNKNKKLNKCKPWMQYKFH